MTDVYVEKASKRVFACALDWPGWCRAGKTEEAALASLAASAPQYALIAKQAGLPFDLRYAGDLVIVERLRGTVTTDFGAPDVVADRDRAPLPQAQAVRLASLVEAAWMVFDRVASKAPESLRKGPRGGGRDRDQIVAHVTEAEDAYARKIGVREKDLAARRRAILDAIGGASKVEAPEKGWPIRYAARRIAWHVIDHTWEIEDRSR